MSDDSYDDLSDEEFKKKVNYKENPDGSVEFNDLSKIADLSADLPESESRDKKSESKPKPNPKKYKNKNKEDEDGRPIFYANKFNGYNISDFELARKTLYESVIIGRQSCYIYQRDNGELDIIDEIDDFDRRIQPSSRHSRQAKARTFDFTSKEELEKMWQDVDSMTIDDFYEDIKSIFSKYIAANDDVIVFLSATTIFTYFIDRFDIVYYPFIIGEHGSGKTAILDVMDETAYRTMMSSSQSEAAVYNSLGYIEPAQQTMLLDEAHIAKGGMLEILKSGYDKKGKVHRVQDTTSGRIVIEQSTFCMKILIGDRHFEGEAAKPVNDRCFEIKASPTKIKPPMLYIKDVLRTKNAIYYQNELAEMSNFRRYMLLYRIKHYHKNFPKAELSVYNRDRELVQSVIELFHDSIHLNEIISSLANLLNEKRHRKNETKDAILCKIIKQFSDINNYPCDVDLRLKAKIIEKVNSRIDKDEVFGVANEWIWTVFMEETGAQWKFQDKDGLPKKTMMTSDDYGEFATNALTNIMGGKFGGIRDKFTRIERGFIFSKKMIDNLVESYATNDNLSIIKFHYPDKTETGDS